MPRTVKTITTEEGNEVEVYADECNVCHAEMLFPKAEADRIDAMFPFLKEKIEAGSPCVKCAVQMEQEENKTLLSEEEVEKIKNFIMNKVK